MKEKEKEMEKLSRPSIIIGSVLDLITSGKLRLFLKIRKKNKEQKRQSFCYEAQGSE